MTKRPCHIPNKKKTRDLGYPKSYPVSDLHIESKTMTEKLDRLFQTEILVRLDPHLEP